MSLARKILGQWLSTPALSRLPNVRRQFDLNRDPYIARQILDQEKSESQRRSDTARGDQGRGRPQDKPAPALKPPPKMRGREEPQGWLTAQRDAVFAAAAAYDAEVAQQAERTPSLSRSNDMPSL
ncbi:hypothetical protein [Minwuia sp.]|uniref:hypothetical protein n=1 Tax=Minwuia sp. TaxID=2493630 RepID=UPI003A9005AE